MNMEPGQPKPLAAFFRRAQPTSSWSGPRACVGRRSPTLVAWVAVLASWVPGAASCVLGWGGKPYRAGFSVVLPCEGSQALLTGGCAGCACGELLTLATPPAAASACSLPSARAASGRNASTTVLYRARAGRLNEKNSTTKFGRGASAFRRLGPRAILPLTILARLLLSPLYFVN